jgi:hypothetical protein
MTTTRTIAPLRAPLRAARTAVPLRAAPFLAAALALGACSYLPWSGPETPVASPPVIARHWCETHHAGNEACLATAEAAHRQCITAPGSYDSCRERLLSQSAGK